MRPRPQNSPREPRGELRPELRDALLLRPAEPRGEPLRDALLLRPAELRGEPLRDPLLLRPAELRGEL